MKFYRTMDVWIVTCHQTIDDSIYLTTTLFTNEANANIYVDKCRESGAFWQGITKVCIGKSMINSTIPRAIEPRVDCE